MKGEYKVSKSYEWMSSLVFTFDLCPPYLAGRVTNVRLLFMESQHFPITTKQQQPMMVQWTWPKSCSRYYWEALLSCAHPECYSWEKQTKFNFTSFYYKHYKSYWALTPLFLLLQDQKVFCIPSIFHALLTLWDTKLDILVRWCLLFSECNKSLKIIFFG